VKIGRLAENIWKRSVRKNIKSSSIKTVGKRMTMIPFSKRMGAIAVYDLVNSSLALANEIEGIVLNLMIDGRCTEEYVQHIVQDADDAAKILCVKILGFDIHIVQGLKKPVITGYVINDVKTSYCPRKDEDILVINNIAMAGTVIIAEDRFEELSGRFSVMYLEKAKQLLQKMSMQEAISELRKLDITYVAALSEGGINGALWEMADIGKVGLSVNLKDIPIKQETVEVCNFFDINPYELTSSGALLVTCKDGQDVIDKLNESGIEAALIGRTNASNDKLIINEDEKRFLTVPATDGIYEIT